MTPQALSAEAIDQQLARLPGWRLEGHVIARIFHTENWKGTMLLAGALAHLAEVAWHHPQLTLEYGSVTVRLHTHSAGGLTALDFALAEKIDALLAWDPASEGVLEGTPPGAEQGYLKR